MAGVHSGWHCRCACLYRLLPMWSISGRMPRDLPTSVTAHHPWRGGIRARWRHRRDRSTGQRDCDPASAHGCTKSNAGRRIGNAMCCRLGSAWPTPQRISAVTAGNAMPGSAPPATTRVARPRRPTCAAIAGNMSAFGTTPDPDPATCQPDHTGRRTPALSL